MLRRFEFMKVVTLSLFLLGICLMPALAENPTGESVITGLAGNAYYPPYRAAGDNAVAKVAVASVNPQLFRESYRRGYNFKDLRDGYVDVTIPKGVTWLVNVAFSAECRLIDRDKDKYKKYFDNDALLIKLTARDRRSGRTVALQPFDGHQAFCSDDGYATHKGNWFYILKADDYYDTTFRIQVAFLVYDRNRNDKLTGYIDDFTLEAVSYANGRRDY